MLPMFIILFLSAGVALADVDIAKIAQIESSNNPKAYNKRSGAVGLLQITKPCLDDYNNHWGTIWTMQDMYSPDINLMVGEWYINERIPSMLKHYKIADTTRNRLVAYNFGVGNLKNKKNLPTETINYIKKYERLNNG